MSIFYGSMKFLRVILVLNIFCLWAAPAVAAFLNFEPAQQTALPGDSVGVDIYFSEPGGELVAAYNLFVQYDPRVLEVDIDAVAFGSGLGGEENAFRAIEPLEPGLIQFLELSLFQGDLADFQDGTSDLLLFSMAFDVIGTGRSDLIFSSRPDLNPPFLADKDANPIELEKMEAGRIDVVPIPGTIVLMTFGLAGLFGMRGRPWRRRRY